MEIEDGEEIVPNCNRRLQKRRKRHAFFGKARRTVFLEHLAATCNVQASAREAGVAVSTVYANRMRDPEFRAGWEAALEQGYARLEAALLERSFRLGGRPAVRGDKEVSGPDAPEEVDWDKGMELLRHYRRGPNGLVHRHPGTVPQTVPIEQVAARLVKKLKGLGVTLAAEAAAAAAEAPKREGGGGSDGDAGDGRG